MTNTHVVVIGGGYSGAIAANALQAHPDVEITLLNRWPRFVERIRLHELAADVYDATQAFEDLLGERVRLVVDSATHIDREVGRIALASGSSLDYDYLIYAVGSTGYVPSAVSGAAEFTYPLSEFDEAERLRDRLRETSQADPVVIVGGGLTGIEIAGELGEQHRNVTMVTDVLAPSLSSGARRSTARQLARLGVTVIEGLDAAVVRCTADRVVLADGRELPSVVTIWTAGLAVPELAAASGLTTDALGRLVTDETLTSVDDPRIIGAGDAVAPSGHALRMSCQAAGPLGAQAANTVLAHIAGAEPAEISQGFIAQCLSIGRGRGVIQLVHNDDSPRSIFLPGRVAALVKEQVCKGTIDHIRHEAHEPGTYGWFKKGSWRTDQLAALEQASQEA
jgi:NADH:ubiquinone reductase (H+-translocating)